MEGARPPMVLLVAAAFVAVSCGGSGTTDSPDPSEGDAGATSPLGTGVLTVAGIEYTFDVTTCDLDGYENEGVEYDFDTAGIGSIDGRDYHVFARRSYHPDDDWWIETVDLDFQDGDESLHSLHGFSADTPEAFVFALDQDELSTAAPVEFVSDLVEDTPAGQGTVTITCPGMGGTAAASTTSRAPATTPATTVATTSSTTTQPASGTDDEPDPDTTTASTLPDALDLEVWLRLYEALLGAGPYAGLDEEALTAGARAACAGLADDIGPQEIVLAALAETPAASNSVGSDESSLAIFLAVRGVILFCPDLVEDEDAHSEAIVGAITDIIAEQ